MQDLLEELDLVKIVEKHNFFMVKYIIDECLQKEKQQIIDAYQANEGIWDADTYFNEYYNQNK